MLEKRLEEVNQNIEELERGGSRLPCREGGTWVKILDREAYKLTEAAKRFVGQAQSGSSISREAEEPGLGKGQEIKEDAWPHSQPWGHLRHSLCPTASATPWALDTLLQSLE